VLPVSRSSEMITFTLGDGSVVTLRASGTEPKIKYYIELKTEPGKEAGFVSWLSIKIILLLLSSDL
jgi:phosphomannomutase